MLSHFPICIYLMGFIPHKLNTDNSRCYWEALISGIVERALQTIHTRPVPMYPLLRVTTAGWACLPHPNPLFPSPPTERIYREHTVASRQHPRLTLLCCL